MSPILKRDISDQIRHARRLSQALTGSTSPSTPPDERDMQLGMSIQAAYTSSSSLRKGIGVEEGGSGKGWSNYSVKGKEVERHSLDEEVHGMLTSPLVPERNRGRIRVEELEYEEQDVGPGKSSGSAKLKDLRNLLLEASPSLLFNLIGEIFTGELLEHLARWRVFIRVDELFILVPMIGNLKGNLEMCLSARLGTSANIGELDHRPTRQTLLHANLTLLGLQALLISSLAAVISFVLGLLTIHRVGDGINDNTGLGGIDPGLAVGEQDFKEGYTRPGWKQLVMVLATGMGAAGLSSAVLGCFMGYLIILSRWAGLDPDNITAPVAACLGDLLAVFLLALLGAALVGTMDTPLPLIAVILMSIAAGWFTQKVMKNEWVRKVAKGGWIPLIGAMLISSGTGMILDKGVGKYRGFALLAISRTGLTGSIGAIHANRLTTGLHTQLAKQPKASSQLTPMKSPSYSNLSKMVSKSRSMLVPHEYGFALFLLGFPMQGLFLWFVRWAGWIDLSLGWSGWVTFALTSIISIFTGHGMTLWFWSRDLDPDSYTLPIHSAVVDFLGQLLLMVSYEICIKEGRDVMVRFEDLPKRLVSA